MSNLTINAVQEFKEVDKDQGIERVYLYYKQNSHTIQTGIQSVDIIQTPSNGRMLFLDGVLQSSTQDEVIYHNALVHPLMDCLNHKKSILILGGGEGATAREVLRWNPATVYMVDYDKQLVDFMRKYGDDWSKGAFKDSRLRLIYEDAWKYMARGYVYDGVIIDLTDPNLYTQAWRGLIELTLKSVKPKSGGFVMNAGLYQPWNTAKLDKLLDIIQNLCMRHLDYKYYIYTAFIPSFAGEWTFIVVSHRSKFMVEPEFLNIIPEWIRRSIRMLPDSAIYGLSCGPITTPIRSE